VVCPYYLMKNWLHTFFRGILPLGISIFLGCSEIEESIHYYDKKVYERFIIKLDRKGISYRKGYELSVFYPLSESERVLAVKKEIESEYFTGCGGSMVSPERQMILEAALMKSGIPFKIVITDEGEKVVCQTEYQEAFHEIFEKALKGDIK